MLKGFLCSWMRRDGRVTKRRYLTTCDQNGLEETGEGFHLPPNTDDSWLLPVSVVVKCLTSLVMLRLKCSLKGQRACARDWAAFNRGCETRRAGDVLFELCSEDVPKMRRNGWKCFWNPNRLSILPVLVKNSGSWHEAFAAYLQLMCLASSCWGNTVDRKCWHYSYTLFIFHNYSQELYQHILLCCLLC